jgi:hypothetical protein
MLAPPVCMCMHVYACACVCAWICSIGTEEDEKSTKPSLGSTCMYAYVCVCICDMYIQHTDMRSGQLFHITHTHTHKYAYTHTCMHTCVQTYRSRHVECTGRALAMAVGQVLLHNTQTRTYSYTHTNIHKNNTYQSRRVECSGRACFGHGCGSGFAP